MSFDADSLFAGGCYAVLRVGAVSVILTAFFEAHSLRDGVAAEFSSAGGDDACCALDVVMGDFVAHGPCPILGQGLGRGVLVAVLLLSGTGAGLAQGPPAAIGRISYGVNLQAGDAICSGVLVAPALVLTAAHCVRIDDPAAIRFDVGWTEGRGLAVGRGAEVIFAPRDAVGAGVLAGPVGDLALVVLAEPIPIAVATPLSLTDAEARPGDRFTLIAYRRDAPDRPQRSDACMLLATVPGFLGLSCPAVSGNSGAPLLEWDGTGWRIAAVMVATSRVGTVRSWAAILPLALRARIVPPG